MKLKALFFISFLLLSLITIGQETESEVPVKIRKNIFHATGGYAIYYLAADINYERLIGETNNEFIHSIWVRLGGGGWIIYGDEGKHFLAAVTILSGSNNNHFELSLGMAYMYSDRKYDQGYIPAGAIGYRYQKPGSRFVFRTGFGVPETAYISLGLCF